MTGSLEVDGQPIASRELLPRIYENREFAPAWKTLRQIDCAARDARRELSRGARSERLSRGSAASRSRDADRSCRAGAERARRARHLADRQHHPLGLPLAVRQGRSERARSELELRRASCSARIAAATIQEAIDSPSLREFAARAIPRVFLYERFKTALAEYRALEANGGWPSVPAGADADSRAARTSASRRSRRASPSPASCRPRPPSTERCTTSRSPRLSGGFRRATGSRADGAVGPATLAALNVPVAARIEQLRANLERARWVFYDPESEFLVVNIAGFQLYHSCAAAKSSGARACKSAGRTGRRRSSEPR